MAFEEQSKGSPRSADIDSLPQPVEDENLLIQKPAHSLKLRGNLS
jgi:hypothetical protein